MIYEPVDALTWEELAADAAARPATKARQPLSHWWGIDWVEWLLAVRIRILFVIDGRINTEHGPRDFGLGPVIDTLRSREFAWWVRFHVTVVDRDAPECFRFTQPGFNIDDYDQVWFFGDWPGVDANASLETLTDDMIQREKYSPLDDAELRIVADWMDRGGGVFAAGDHTLLGASMCSRIPRVRNMRKWTKAQSVPSFAEPDRHETLVHAPQGGLDEWEGDRWGQQIFPVYRSASRVVFHQFPHPLLCGRSGIIDRFPDHMHEGSVIEDDDVPLDEPLDIPGYSGKEFPIPEPVLHPAIGPTPDVFSRRPRPEVIAYGLTTNAETAVRRFPLIGVYDGDPVKVGRVVVDSTWHHWFSLNLVGFQAHAPEVYAGMQDYYRNVGLWLATPQQRAFMLILACWGVLVGKQPGAFDRALGIWDLGERVVDAIGRTAPQCILTELVATFLETRELSSPASSRASSGSARRRPARVKPPVRLANEAIVGGIAFELVELAHHHIREQALGRKTQVDGGAILERGLRGVRTGVRELGEALSESYAPFAQLEDRLRDPFRPAAGSDKAGTEPGDPAS
jgi:hypothetical protein